MTQPTEATLYENNRITVTDKRAVFSGTSYALANITSVAMSEIPPNTSGQGVFFIGGVVAIVLGLLLDEQRWLCLGGGAILLLLGFVLYRGTKPTYAVKVGTSGAEKQAYVSSDKVEIEKIVAALNEAIVKRG